MSILPKLREALGVHAPIDRYRVVAELAGGHFGMLTPDSMLVFFGGGDKSYIYTNVGPDSICVAMDRLVEKVMTKYGITQSEVEMRLELNGAAI